MDRIALKMGTSANSRSHLQSQRLLVAYLDDLTSKATPPGRLDAMMEAIMIDGYNRMTSAPAGEMPGKDVGEAEPLSDQLMLLATLFIWLVLVPVGFAIARRRRRRARAHLLQETP